ncbi:hypothetical protein U1Q18_034564 [Sarracenia purpurea var. burkii]
MESLTRRGCELALHHPNSLYSPIFPLIFASCCNKSSKSRPFGLYSSSSSYPFPSISSKLVKHGFGRKFSLPSSEHRRGIARPGDLPDARQSETLVHNVDADEDEDADNGKRHQEGSNEKFINDNQPRGVPTVIGEAFPQENSAIVSACFVGLLTGISVVIFNNALEHAPGTEADAYSTYRDVLLADYASNVHEIRDFFWDGIPYRGASWLREEPIEVIWERVVAVPVCGGLMVGMLNVLRGTLEGPTNSTFMSNVKVSLEPILKTVAACITLGTGNSLGPEGPSVEIGASIAKGVGTLFDGSTQMKLSLVAAGSAAGISSG